MKPIYWIVAFFVFVAVISNNASSQELKTRNVILVTADGLRTQEVFGGIDPILLNNKEKSGIESVDVISEKYWRDSPQERREALMPFFWNVIAKQGTVLGNQKLGSSVKVKNPYLFSYPGYAEILTGMPRPSIDSNDPVQNPFPTVLDFLKSQLNLSNKQVAVFASWSVFNAIVTHDDGSFYVNAGYEAVPDDLLTDGMKKINQQQFEMPTPWDSVRHDVVTAELALEYLKANSPRVLYIALGETDDWAHERRYDRVLITAHYYDAFLKELWNTVQAMDEYKDCTTIVMAADHGRGVTVDDWAHHSPEYPGSDNIWIAIMGPDSPTLGEMKDAPDYFQANISATILSLLGINYEEYNPSAFPPIKEALK